MKPKELFSDRSPAAKALYRLYEVPEIRRQLPSHLDPAALERMSTIAAALTANPVASPDVGAFHQVERQLEELYLSTTPERISALRSSYDYAKQRLMPLTTQHTAFAQLINTVGSDFQLVSISLEETRDIDVQAASDKNIEEFRKELLSRLRVAIGATDANKTTATGQLLETLEELRAYCLFKPRLEHLEKITETTTSTPDFRASFKGRPFFLELKVPDVVGGQTTHRQDFAESTNVKIQMEGMAGNRGIRTGYQEYTPYGANGVWKPSLTATEVLNSRVRTVFKASQFELGPTVGVIALTRLPVSEPHRAIRRLSEDGSHKESGVLWNAAFSPIATDIFGPGGLEGQTTSSGFFRDPAYRFPGMALITLHRLLSDRQATPVGLMNRAGGNIGGWSKASVAELLEQICDDWNDDDDS